MYQKRDELNRKVDERRVAHNMSRIHGYSVKVQRCYEKQDWGAKIEQIYRINALGALMGSTLRSIGFLTGSVKVLMCWVENMVLTNISDKKR
ncbi:hypothetical protein [Holospora curviuscula]|uniref:hypothetical protein n=1 Tax=Holospora curviuscula TaxID=1082868 RepID=UPI001A9C9720|nr:hypothetical protein [Holospora curviuscula]